MAICWKREWKSQPIINITRLLSSEPWSITFAKSTRSMGADDLIQSVSRITGKLRPSNRERHKGLGCLRIGVLARRPGTVRNQNEYLGLGLTTQDYFECIAAHKSNGCLSISSMTCGKD